MSKKRKRIKEFCFTYGELKRPREQLADQSWRISSPKLAVFLDNFGYLTHKLPRKYPEKDRPQNNDVKKFIELSVKQRMCGAMYRRL